MFERLQAVAERFDELEAALADPEIAVDPTRSTKLSRERAEILETVETFRGWVAVCEEQELTQKQVRWKKHVANVKEKRQRSGDACIVRYGCDALHACQGGPTDELYRVSGYYDKTLCGVCCQMWMESPSIRRFRLL